MAQQVFNNSMVAHVWAQQTQERGRNSRGSLYFEGPTLYSYGPHFPIATITRTPKGAEFVAFNTDSASITTSSHQSLALGAVSGRRVIHTPNPERFNERHPLEPDDLERIAESFRERFAAALSAAGRARTYKAHHLEQAQRIAADARWLAEQFDYPAMAIDLPEDLEQAAEDARRQQAEADKARRERERERRDAMKHAEAERFKQWQAGEPVPFPNSWSPPDGTALLTYRAEGDAIVTSKGASFPADHARRVWPILRRLRQEQQAGQDLHPRSPGKPLRLGHFAIDTLEPGGTIRAGCHRVKWDEVERIARVLDLEPINA